ncbi:hypothetical protein HJP15_15945 [Pseudoalteromonas sp. NEC-BIFX-2020_002]|uniref:Uncharacterized protein n=2 Tax=Pseudoalteromonas TaxID=53246 RepID=A0A0N1EQJ1_9GAMM|nr:MULTISPECIES: hypothetical protein [Pseudoalteromonas]KPH64237.1 hypothetical protein ADS77_05995 [Pseudoalteromonas porphyrae]NMR23999.1 hypothetical protein [Pseudoalteromonas sp. NEC-BIFX-2020_015]NNG44396.1 hypothetical protein [Pseudoalteromonas sp. NEC-BIFX-2020_002]
MKGIIYFLLAIFVLLVCYNKLVERKVVVDYHKMSEQMHNEAKLKQQMVAQDIQRQMQSRGGQIDKHILLHNIDPTIPKVGELEQRCKELTLKSDMSQSIYDKNIAELECEKYEAYKLASES